MVEELRDPSRRVAGVKQLLRALAAGTVECAFVAADAEPALVNRVLAAAKAASVRAVRVDSMDALGRACRIGVGTAAAGLLRNNP